MKLFLYIFVMAMVTYLIRMIPFAFFSKKIKSRFFRSFLYYIPYAVLTAMTLPAIFYATDYILSALAGLLVAVLFALKNKGLTKVAIAACIAVYITEQLL